MADKKEKKETAPAPGKKEGKKKGGGKAGIIIFMIVFGMSFWFIFPTLVLFLIGMAPTFIVFLIDTDRQKLSTGAVAAMNAAGVTPFIIDLWSKQQTMEAVFQILREPSTWMVMMGAAGVGWLIVFAVPQAVATLKLAQSEARLKILRSNLETLKDVWGPDVGTTKPIDKVGQN